VFRAIIGDLVFVQQSAVNQLFFPGIQRNATSVQRGHTARDVKPLMCTEGSFWVYTLGYTATQFDRLFGSNEEQEEEVLAKWDSNIGLRLIIMSLAEMCVRTERIR
jgi:hypothetical protein